MNRCKLCNKDENVFYKDSNQNYIVKIAPFGTLILNDGSLKHEYLYTIHYCPFCGKKVD